MRTIAIAVTVIALLVAAAICYRAPVATLRVPGGPALVVEEQGTDWAAILSIIAGALTAIEVAIRTILQLIAKRKATPTPEAQDAATPTPATPKPPDG